MLGYFNPSVILTYIGLVSAALGLSFCLRGQGEGVLGAVFCLMLSGVCDLFDGAVAARVKRGEKEKAFGVQIDSLCDLVAFGALPACLVISLAGNTLFSRISAALLLLSSVIRLGYFNVQEMDRDPGEKRLTYTGVPVTMVALLLPLFLGIGVLLQLPMGVFAPASLCLFAFLEVWKVKWKKPQGAGKILLLALGVLIFAGLLFLRRRL